MTDIYHQRHERRSNQRGAASQQIDRHILHGTFSVVCDVDLPEGVEENAYYFWISLLDQIYWVLGSLLGSIIGNTLPFNSAGVEFS